MARIRFTKAVIERLPIPATGRESTPMTPQRRAWPSASRQRDSGRSTCTSGSAGVPSESTSARSPI